MEGLHSQVYQFRKLFQSWQAVAEELFRVDKVNELQRNLRERMMGIRTLMIHPSILKSMKID